MAGRQRGNRDEFPKIPDTKSWALDERKMKDVFGDRYVMLKEQEEYAEVMKITDFKNIPRHLQQFVPQDHGFFMEMRQKRRGTGSTYAHIIGFHDIITAKLLDLPEIMYIKDPNNELLDQMIMFKKYGIIPRPTLHQPGPCWAENGKDHEANVNATILSVVPNMTFYETGTIVIENTHLEFFDVYDAFDPAKKPLRNMKLEIAVSPDYRCRAPEWIKKDAIGTVTYGPMQMMAGEQKVPTVFMPQPNSDFPGVDFFFIKNRKCWDYPKQYYIPQLMLEMLALMTRSNLFSCWTYGRGMRTWKIDMDREYLSIILTIGEYLYTEFVLKDKPVPTDYFMKLEKDDPKRVVYTRLITMTNDICRYAKIYLDTPGEVTSKITDDIGVLSKQTYLEFPQIPDFVTPYHQLAIYGRRFYEDFTDLHWPKDWDCLDERGQNIEMLLDTELTLFATKIAANIVHTYTAEYHPMVSKEPVTVQAALEKAELYAVHIYKLISGLYGSPKFGTALNEEAFYNNLVRRAYCAYKALLTGRDIIGKDNKAYKEHREKTWKDVSSLEFVPQSHHKVFGTTWVTKVKDTCLHLSRKLIGEKANDKYFKAETVEMHFDLLSDKENFLSETSASKEENNNHPTMWQYQRLIAVIVAIDALEENIYKIK